MPTGPDQDAPQAPHAQHGPTRRGLLAGAAAAVLVGRLPEEHVSADAPQASPSAAPVAPRPAPATRPTARPASEPFLYCLNTSTISGSNLDIVQMLEIAAKTGYQGVEPWIRDVEAYTKKGGSLKDLARRISDLGLTVESAIGFAPWIVEDDAERAKGLEQMKREMDVVRQIGGARIAAPAAGAQDRQKHEPIELPKIAERYRAVLEVGDQAGVVPMIEVWGFSVNLSKLGEATYAAIESRHPRACILADVYHLYKGGSDARAMRLLSADAMHVLHFNDYPADPPREKITDAHRVYPGDGVAPLDEILRTLRETGFRGALSLELFNRDYWRQSPVKVAQAGIDKMRAAVRKALG